MPIAFVKFISVEWEEGRGWGGAVGSGRQGTNSKASRTNRSLDATVGDDETRQARRQTTDGEDFGSARKIARAKLAKAVRA